MLACAGMAAPVSAQEPSHEEIIRALVPAFRDRYASFALKRIWLNGEVRSARPDGSPPVPLDISGGVPPLGAPVWGVTHTDCLEAYDHRECGIGTDDMVLVLSRPHPEPGGGYSVRVVALHALREGRIWTGFTSEARLKSTQDGWRVVSLRPVSVF